MRANQPVEQSAFLTQHTQQHNGGPDRLRVIERTPFQRTTTGRTSCLQPRELTDSQTVQTRLATGGKSPAYLRGKNPYGTVLDRIDHPYRDARGAVIGPPSQLGAGPGGRIRTSGAFRFKTKDPSTQPESAANEQDFPPRLLMTEQPITPSSVKAAKSLIGSQGTRSSLALQSRPPDQPPAVKDAAPDDNRHHYPSLLLVKPEPAHRSSMYTKHPSEADTPNPGSTSIPRLSSSTRTETTQYNNSSDRTRASGSRAGSMTSKANKRVVSDDAHNPSSTVSPISRTRWNKVDNSRPHTGAFIIPVTNTVSKGNGQRQAPEKTVRSRGKHSYSSATENEEDAKTGAGHRCQQESERSGSSRHVRGNVEEDRQLGFMRLRRTESEVAPTEKSTTLDRPHDRVLAWTRSVSPHNSTRQDMRSYYDNVKINADAHGPEKDGTARSLGDDNRVIRPTLSQDDTARDVTQTANVGVQPGYDDMQVPDHVDWRAAYGRRKTQDFGFPGARIKPHRANWNQRPPAASSGRSALSQTTSTSVDGIAQSHPLSPVCDKRDDPCEVKKQHEWKQASQKPSKFSIVRSSSALRREQHHLSRMQSDKCGGRLANTLGYMIDGLLQEHSSSLQQVIDNIDDGQRNLSRLRQSPDKIEMHTGAAYTTYQPPRTHSEVVRLHRNRCETNTQLHDQFISWLQGHKWQPLFSHFPPTQAERLNVGATGQIRPNVNDSYHVLRQNLRTVDDLVDLIESAADNFGVDLARRPTASDEERYHDAPYEWD